MRAPMARDLGVVHDPNEGSGLDRMAPRGDCTGDANNARHLDGVLAKRSRRETRPPSAAAAASAPARPPRSERITLPKIGTRTVADTRSRMVDPSARTLARARGSLTARPAALGRGHG